MNTDLSPCNLFTPEAFEAHLAKLDAPAWFIDLKRRHWQDFTTLPMPTRQMERWRFTKLSQLRLDGFAPVNTAPADSAERLIQHLELSEDAAARVGFVDNQLVLRGTDLPTGVEVLTLPEALKAHEGYLRDFFNVRAAMLGMDKFFALHMAFLNEGMYIRVPRGVALERPIEVHYLSRQPGTLLTPHTLLIAEENSQVELIEYHGQLGDLPAEPTPGLSVGLGTVHTRQNAVVKRVYVQDHRPGMQCYQSEEATAERDVSLQSTAINIGASYARLEGATIAAGSGADVHLYSMGAPTGTQVFDQRTLQVHRASHARSDLLFKNALLDKSQTIFSGMIVVEDEAQQTDAYQTNNNLLLSPTAEANSLPGLEIEANDVKCSHGATSGQVDSEQLFYLKARGIPERQAYELLVFGFFEEVLGKIASDDVHEKLADKVKAKFEA